MFTASCRIKFLKVSLYLVMNCIMVMVSLPWKATKEQQGARENEAPDRVPLHSLFPPPNENLPLCFYRQVILALRNINNSKFSTFLDGIAAGKIKEVRVNFRKNVAAVTPPFQQRCCLYF